MEEVIDYFVEQHEKLGNSCDTSNKIPEHYQSIAMDMAYRLIEQGLRPVIAVARSESVDYQGTREPVLLKTPYGIISLDSYQVCCADGLVWDPVIDLFPTPIAHFRDRAFANEVRLEVVLREESIRQMGNR